MTKHSHSNLLLFLLLTVEYISSMQCVSSAILLITWNFLYRVEKECVEGPTNNVACHLCFTYLYAYQLPLSDCYVIAHYQKQSKLRKTIPWLSLLLFLHNLGPNDYVALDNLRLTIPSNSAVGASACGSVTIVGDDIAENEEVFQVLVITDDSDDQISGTPRFTITITSESGDGMFALYQIFICF